MRMHLKGINSATKHGSPMAASSSTGTLGVTVLGSWRARHAEFIDSYNEAVARKVKAPSGTLQAVLEASPTQQASPD